MSPSSLHYGIFLLWSCAGPKPQSLSVHVCSCSVMLCKYYLLANTTVFASHSLPAQSSVKMPEWMSLESLQALCICCFYIQAPYITIFSAHWPVVGLCINHPLLSKQAVPMKVERAIILCIEGWELGGCSLLCPLVYKFLYVFRLYHFPLSKDRIERESLLFYEN